MSTLWAKLAPASARLERGSSSNDKITAADVAGAAAQLPQGPFLAGLTFLAGDDRQRDNLAMELSREADCNLSMARAAVWDMAGGERCRRCNGRGVLAPQVQCPTCFGRRVVKPTAKRLAELCGVSRATWYRGEQRRYDQVYSLLDSWVSLASRHVSRALRH